MSSIEWTDTTWNPIVGCDRLSPGCDHCYAIKMASRLTRVDHYNNVVAKGDWTGVINLAPDRIVAIPLRRSKPTVYFVNSMSDMFHEMVEDEWLIRFFDIMNRCPQHIFQLLTKRPARMVKKTQELGLKWSRNIWAGTSIEEDKYARPRVRELLKVPASIRFVSCEPLLGPLPSLDVAALDWVIAGGESGIFKTVRPCDPAWLRELRDRCRATSTPFFFKQWGAYDGSGKRGSKKDNGHLLDAEEIFEMPAVAYDMLSSPDARWTRIAKVAQPTPSKRKAASAYPFVAAGEGTDDLTDFIFHKMASEETTFENPNVLMLTKVERDIRKEAEETEGRWVALLN